MRVHFDGSDPAANVKTLRYRFGPVADGLPHRLDPERGVALAPDADHGVQNIEIPAIVSDHRDFESLAETYGVEGHAINIRHPFLPGSNGARPYEQAYARGVKLVDATVRWSSAEQYDMTGARPDSGLAPVVYEPGRPPGRGAPLRRVRRCSAWAICR